MQVSASKEDDRNFCPYCDNKTLETLRTEYEKAINSYPNNLFVIKRCSHCRKLSFIHIVNKLVSKTPMPETKSFIVYGYPLEVP